MIKELFFDYNGKEVISIQDYAKLIDKEVKDVGHALKRLSEQNKLLENIDFFQLSPQQAKELNLKTHESYGTKCLTESSINVLKGHFKTSLDLNILYLLGYRNGGKIGICSDLKERLNQYQRPWNKPIETIHYLETDDARSVEAKVKGAFKTKLEFIHFKSSTDCIMDIIHYVHSLTSKWMTEYKQ